MENLHYQISTTKDNHISHLDVRRGSTPKPRTPFELEFHQEWIER